MSRPDGKSWYVASDVVVVLLCLIIGQRFRDQDAAAARFEKQDAKIEAQVVVLRRQQAELKRQQAQLKRESYDRCVSGNTGRKVLQGILDQAANPSPTGAAAIDFASISHWDELDPGNQRYLRSLGEALQAQAGTPNSIKIIADNYRRTNPQVNCDPLKPGGN